MNKKYYLAYGSNLNIEDMKKRCPQAKIFAKADLVDYELLFKGRGSDNYLTVEAKKGESLPLAVWETSESDELALDKYEGYPDLYYKKDLTVNVREMEGQNIKKLTGYIYIMNEDRGLGDPSQAYFKTCLEGYKNFDFDPEILYKAKEKSSK